MSMKRKIMLTLGICTFIGLPAVAQTTLTIDQARQEALTANKDISKSRLILEKNTLDMKAFKTNYYPRIDLVATDFWSNAKADLSLKGGNLPIYVLNPATGQYVPNVTVNADGSYTMNQYAYFPDQSYEMKVKNMLMAGVILQQPLYMGGKINAAYHMSKIGREMAHENIRLSKTEVITKTDEAYTLAVKAKELKTVAEAYTKLLVELKKNVDSAVKHGLKNRNDLLKVQVKLNEAELSVQKAENAWTLACMNLCHMIGKPLDTQLDVSSQLPEVQIDLAGQTDLSKRPESNLLAKKVDLAGEQVKLQKSEYLPNLGLFASYDYANGGEIAGKQLINNGAITVGVTLKVPILNFGESTHKIRSAKVQQQITMLEQADLNEQMALELQQARNNCVEAQTEAKMTLKSLEQAEENLKLSRAQYDVGMEPLSDLLDAQAIWQQSAANVINARCSLFLTWTKYQKAAGILCAE